MLQNNNDIFVLDFSLDDPQIDKISRLVGSWVQTPSTDIKFPKGKDDRTLLARRLGLTYLANCTDRYLCHDSTFGNAIEKITEEIKRVKIELETLKPGTKLVVCIDSFHDLNIDSEKGLTETMKYNKLAQWAADLAIELDLVFMFTGELKKMERENIRPNMNSLRESIKIKYEAKAILLVYNDVHYNQDSAEIFYLDKQQRKQPVLEVHIAKNKISSWKGRLFYYMWADKGYLKECDEGTAQDYRNKINK